MRNPLASDWQCYLFIFLGIAESRLERAAEPLDGYEAVVVREAQNFRLLLSMDLSASA